MVQRHNELCKRIRNATVDNISELFYDVRDFYTECKEIDNVSVKRIVSIYIEKLQEMCNAALYSRGKKHFIFDNINPITAPSFR